MVAGFSRYHKYTLGTELRNKSREVVAAVIKANSSRDKLPRLLALRERLEELMILVRLAANSKFKPAIRVLPRVSPSALTPRLRRGDRGVESQGSGRHRRQEAQLLETIVDAHAAICDRR